MLSKLYQCISELNIYTKVTENMRYSSVLALHSQSITMRQCCLFQVYLDGVFLVEKTIPSPPSTITQIKVYIDDGDVTTAVEVFGIAIRRKN